MPYSTANGIKIYYEVSEELAFCYGSRQPLRSQPLDVPDRSLLDLLPNHCHRHTRLRPLGQANDTFSLKEMADDVLGVCRDEA